MAEDVITAVIAAAGSATRMWPASKSVPKELFPLGRVPAIIHLVWELLDSGVQHIIIVASAEGMPLVKQLFDPSIEPPSKVAADPIVRRFQQIFDRAKLTFQVQAGSYGNGTPLKQAADLFGPAPCIYAFGDDIVFGENISCGLISAFADTGCPVLAVQHVDPGRAHQFGIVECDIDGKHHYVSELVEKPSAGETNSTLAAFGRYLVTPDLIDSLRTTEAGRNDEVWFVDSVIQRMREGGRVCALPLTTGRWYTVGDPSSYAQAVVAAQNQR